MGIDSLAARIRRLLRRDDLAILTGEERHVDPKTYDALFERVAPELRRRALELDFARGCIENRYQGFSDLPDGRRQTFLQNSSPAMLVTLARDLMQQSYAERFGNASRSLQLAQLAVEALEYLGSTPYLSAESLSDLRAEAFAKLANARRLNSDLIGAETTLLLAKQALDAGTGDRELKADYFSLLASLRNSQGRVSEAADLVDRELALRRLLADGEKLGVALIDRGLWTCSTEGPTRKACGFIRQGLELVDDQRMQLQGLLHLAEAFAREEMGVQAWKPLCVADLLVHLTDAPSLQLRHRWIKGLACRALGERSSAMQDLSSVRQEFVEREAALPAAIISLDLLPLYFEQGRFDEMQRLAMDAYQVFVAERLGEPALGAVLALRAAIETQEVTQGQLVAVANFLGRLQHNRALSFQWANDR